MTKSQYEKRREYRDQYIRDNYRTFAVKINRNKYPDIIEKIEGQDNIVQYLVSLISKDLENKRV